MATMSIGFSSCSEDDDDNNVSENVIIGKWISTSDDGGSFEFKNDGTLIHERKSGSKLTGSYKVEKVEKKDYGTFFTIETDYNDSYIGLYLSYMKNPEMLDIAGLRNDINLPNLLLGSYKRQ